MSSSLETTPLLRRLSASDETACLALLAHLCRQCPAFRVWLWDGFGRDSKQRKRLAEIVDNAKVTFPERLADLSDDGQPWREERERLRDELTGRAFGGLSRAEIERLIRRYQAGTIDLGTFLMVHEWREPDQASPALLWAGAAFLDSLLPTRDWRTHTHIAKAFTFLRRFGKKAPRRASFSYTDWWKARVLFYILRHPRPSYRTRELRAHLATLGAEVSTKDIRRFCSRHGIRRDIRAGRPRTRLLARAAC